jgi:hypothetical protein
MLVQFAAKVNTIIPDLIYFCGLVLDIDLLHETLHLNPVLFFRIAFAAKPLVVIHRQQSPDFVGRKIGHFALSAVGTEEDGATAIEFNVHFFCF